MSDTTSVGQPQDPNDTSDFWSNIGPPMEEIDFYRWPPKPYTFMPVLDVGPWIHWREPGNATVYTADILGILMWTGCV